MEGGKAYVLAIKCSGGSGFWFLVLDLEVRGLGLGFMV